jgi:hypothetical protein
MPESVVPATIIDASSHAPSHAGYRNYQPFAKAGEVLDALLGSRMNREAFKRAVGEEMAITLPYTVRLEGEKAQPYAA